MKGYKLEDRAKLDMAVLFEDKLWESVLVAGVYEA